MPDLNPAQQQYLSWLPKWLLGTFAAGAALRGTTGLAEMIGNNLKQPPTPPEPMMINIPYRSHTVPDPLQPTTTDPNKRSKRADITDPKWWAGSTAESPSQIPLSWPATLFGGVGAYLGGRKLVNMLIDRQKEQTKTEEMEDAKSEYEKAMLKQFTPIHPSKVKSVPLRNGPSITKIGTELTPTIIQSLIEKTAEDDKLRNVADKLDQLAEKQATWWNPLTWLPGSWGRYAGGTYATAAPLLALGAGLGVHTYMKKHDATSAEAEAAKQRMQERMYKTPDVYARLVPVDAQGNAVKEEKKRQTELADDQPPMKAASDLDAQAAAFVKELFG